MIKIIEHGNHPRHIGRCTRCGCKIECAQEDVMYERGITGAPMYVICPECGEHIRLTESHIPAGTSFTVTSDSSKKNPTI